MSIGWTGFTPDRSSPVGELVEFGMTEGKKIVAEKGGSISPMRVMRRTVAGEELVAVLSDVTMDGAKVNGCRVYDVGETRRITQADAERWTGRAPSRAQEDEVIAVAAWEPGYAAEHDSLEVFFVPAASPAITFVKVSGIALKADFVGATD